ncbi:MAG: molecular chaperone [Chlorobiaceae bacterium]|nr:molecular chaperone [Chlorobiaceae bacterium]
MKKLFLVALLLLCSVFPRQANAEEDYLKPQFGIYPAMFELEIGNEPVEKSLIVTNLKNRPVTMRVELYSWTYDERHQLKLIQSSPKTLDQWMVLNPVRFTIEPGGIQTIRFSISPRVKPEPGEYRAMLYLIEESDPADAGKGLLITAKLGVGIYAYMAPVVRSPKITDMTFNRALSTISLHLLNEGNVHARLRGRYVAWKKNAFSGLGALKKLPDIIEPGHEPSGYLAQGFFPGDPVLPKTERSYNLKLNIPQNSGPYIVAVFGELDGKPVEKLFQ